MPSSTIEPNRSQSKFNCVRLLKLFCESPIELDYRISSNPIIRLSSINKSFDLVRVVTPGQYGFRFGVTMVDCLVDLIDEIRKALDEESYRK